MCEASKSIALIALGANAARFLVEKTHAHLNYDGDLLQCLAKGYNAQTRTLIHTNTLTCEPSSFTHSTHFTESLPTVQAIS